MRKPYRFVTVAVFIAAFVAVYASAVRPWFLEWGATEAEQTMTLPGDSFIPANTVVTTRALTIDATPDEIWPWLLQLGQGRGGFYSYEWLENLFAAQMENADNIVPALQEVRIGDHVSFQQDGPYTKVAYLEPNRAFVVEGGWTWYLQPIDADSTRLIVRYASFEVTNPALAAFYYTIFEPAHFVMEQGMMLGIRVRAEYGT